MTDTNDRIFAAQLLTYRPELRRRALRLSRCEVAADDLTQDTLERALRFRSQYRAGTNLRAWLHQVLFSVFVTRYRRLRRERAALRVLADDPASWASHERFASPEALLPVGEPIRRMLDALPPGFADVVGMVDLGGATYREASILLGIPVGTVMSRLHRARERLSAEIAAPPRAA